MRVLLLHPYFERLTQPIRSLGVAYLASQLRARGHAVTVLNCPVSQPEGAATPDPDKWLDLPALALRLRDLEFDVAGVSCTFAHYSPYSVAIASLVKRHRDVPVVSGGSHPTLCPELVLSHPEIDYVVLGEGEESFPELIESGFAPASVARLDGVGFRRDGSIVINPKQRYIADLDRLPFPDRSMLIWDSPSPMTRFLSIITSRSCPCRCSFCGIPAIGGHRWRTRHPDKVVEELAAMVAEYHPSWILFEDDNLNADRRRLIAICKGIVDQRLNIRWTTANGVQIAALNEEVLTAMWEAGCRYLTLPIESGDDHIRNDVIGKNVSREHIVSMCRVAQRLGMVVEGFFIVGMPGETQRSIDESIRLLRELKLRDAAISYATPFPGSPMYDHCVERGYIDAAELDGRLDRGEVLPLDSPSFHTEDFDRDTLRRWRADLIRAVVESRPTA